VQATRLNRIKNKWWAWILGVLFILILAATIFRLFYLQPWLQKKLEATVSERSGGLYSLAVQKAEVSLLGGTLLLDSLSLRPNFEVWEKQKRKDTAAAPMLGQIKAAQLQLQGLSYIRLLMQKNLQLDKVLLREPQLIIYKMPVTPPPAKPLHQTLTGMLKNLRIGEIRIDKGHLAMKNYQEKQKTMAFNLTNFQLKDLRLDSGSYNDPKRFYYAQEVKLQANSLDVLLPMAFYRLKIDRASLSSSAKTIALTQAKLVPLYSAAGMSRKINSALTQFSLTAPQVKLAGVGFPDFSRNGNITLGAVKIVNPRLTAYKDALHFKDRVPQLLPHQIIQKLKTGLTINKIQVTNLDIGYRELSRKTGKVAAGTFENMNLTITNISNDKNRMTTQTPAVINGSLLVMGKTSLAGTIRYNLLSPNGYHTIRGTIGNGQPEILNPILEQDQLIRVKSGTVQKGHFNMELTNNRITGTMQLHYLDFKVDMLSKPKAGSQDKKPKQSLGKKILSVFANKVVLNTNNNPAENGFKVGEINTPHRKNRSVITYWIDGLTSGIRSSLGLSSKVPA